MIILLGIIFGIFTALQFIYLNQRIRSTVLMNESYKWLRFLLAPIISIDTLLHEFSHLLSAILMGSQPSEIHINFDGSGHVSYAVKQNASKLALSFISLSGYIGSSLFSLYFVHLISKGQYNLMFTILSTIIIYSILLALLDTLGTVPNLNTLGNLLIIGVLFISIDLIMKYLSPSILNINLSMVSILIILGISILLIAVGRYGLVWSIALLVVILQISNTGNVELYMDYISVIILFSAFANSIMIFFISINSNLETDGVSDAHQLKNYTGISEKFWGTLFLLVGLVAFIKGIQIVYL